MIGPTSNVGFAALGQNFLAELFLSLLSDLLMLIETSTIFVLQQPITSYFEHSGSGYEVELLKETENDDKEDLSSEEDEVTTEQQMDFTF